MPRIVPSTEHRAIAECGERAPLEGSSAGLTVFQSVRCATGRRSRGAIVRGRNIASTNLQQRSHGHARPNERRREAAIISLTPLSPKFPTNYFAKLQSDSVLPNFGARAGDKMVRTASVRVLWHSWYALQRASCKFTNTHVLCFVCLSLYRFIGTEK